MPLVGIVPSQWRGLVLRPTKKGVVRVNRISYEVCVFQLLREQLRSRAVWVQGAYRYRNPDDDLPQDFNEKRLTYYDALEQPLEAGTFIDRLRQQMVDALSMLDDGVAKNRWLTITESRKRLIIIGSISLTSCP